MRDLLKQLGDDFTGSPISGLLQLTLLVVMCVGALRGDLVVVLLAGIYGQLVYLSKTKHQKTSPCNGTCTLRKGRCIGCGRTIEQIREQGL